MLRVPNAELLLILAAPDSALCLLSIYHQGKLVEGAGVSSLRQLPKDQGSRRGSDCLGLDRGRGNSPGSLSCAPHALGTPIRLTAHPVWGVHSPELAAVWLCSTSLLQEALPALLSPTSHCLITQIAPFTPKEWDKRPFSALRAPTATFPPSVTSRNVTLTFRNQAIAICYFSS